MVAETAAEAVGSTSEAVVDGNTVDELATRSGVGLGAVLAALERLDDTGLVAQHGPWIRRTGRR